MGRLALSDQRVLLQPHQAVLRAATSEVRTQIRQWQIYRTFPMRLCPHPQIAAYCIDLAKHATQAADTVVMNATGGSAAPTAVAMPTCTSGAVLYNTSTHAWSCVSAGSASWAIGAAFDGGGSPLSGTQTECTVVPYSGTITAAYTTADVSGSATITATTVALGSYTGISGAPYATAIPAATNLNLSSALSATPAVSGWTALTAGNMLCVQVTSPSTITHLEVKLAY